ncbi:hypothetical protein ACS3SW_00720 [Roseobacteraceae bacterium S113]
MIEKPASVRAATSAHACFVQDLWTAAINPAETRAIGNSCRIEAALLKSPVQKPIRYMASARSLLIGVSRADIDRSNAVEVCGKKTAPVRAEGFQNLIKSIAYSAFSRA